MPSSTANLLDLSELPTSQRREVHDFVQFLLSRQTSTGKKSAPYRFRDLCGVMNWEGDAVSVQRSLRDEW